jgi:hypothetical protein
VTQTFEELAKDRRDLDEALQKNKAKEGFKRLLTELYPDIAHFIYELLQNAEDAFAKEVRFILHKDRIEFEHDGEKLFSIKDVESITNIGDSTKSDDPTKIGKFGIGFKAVFAYTDTPEIESGEFRFQIRDLMVPERLSKPTALTPGQTRITLPFNNSKKQASEAVHEIEKLLTTLDASTLLFLTSINKIEYLLPDESLSIGYIERITYADNICEIRVQQPNELTTKSSWFIKFDKEVHIEDDEENSNKQKNNKRIAVAFGLSGIESQDNTHKKKSIEQAEWTLAPMKGRVCIYFPAEKEKSDLLFHIHAPFASTVARDSVRDCPENNTIRDLLADLLADSIHMIRDKKLLNVRSLAILPNHKDDLSPFYLPLMDRLVKEFKEQALVPMKRGGHAAASDTLRQRIPSDLIDDDDLATLLGKNYCGAPMWVANPPLRGQREDDFFDVLKINVWTNDDLVSALIKLDDEARAQWMRKKDDAWHQKLYAYLEDRAYMLRVCKIAKISDGTYRKGNECFFPTEEISLDETYPRVSKSTYISDKDEKNKARSFLEAIGVRDVDEGVEIEAILKKYYARNSKFPERNEHYKHLERFILYMSENPSRGYIFKNSFIFMINAEGLTRATPEAVYLDIPFKETGISIYYNELNKESNKYPLSSEYANTKIKTEELVKFAERLDVSNDLPVIDKEVGKNHPEWSHLLANCGERYMGTGRNEDYDIPYLADFLKFPSISKVKCVWRMMKNVPQKYLYAHYGWSASRCAKANSTLVHILRSTEWVPQQTNDGKIEFVQPCTASAAKLPVSEGFEYQEWWPWLKAVEFGKIIDMQTEEYKRKYAEVKELGFNSLEEAETMAKMRNEDPEGYNTWKENFYRKTVQFPSRPVVNPERREERFSEHRENALDKRFEVRDRSVRITSGSIDRTTWLRERYTDDDQMVCQICKKEMPFRKRDKKHYFEAIAVLSSSHFPKELEAQYLALCPLCAAKYTEFVIRVPDVMAKLKQTIIDSETCEIPIFLDEETSIRFVETHYFDLKNIIKS